MMTTNKSTHARVSKKFLCSLDKKQNRIKELVGVKPSRVALTDVLGDYLDSSNLFENVEVKEKKRGKRKKSKEVVFRFEIM